MLTEFVACVCVCGNSGKGKLKGKKGVVSEKKNLPGLEYNFFPPFQMKQCDVLAFASYYSQHAAADMR